MEEKRTQQNEESKDEGWGRKIYPYPKRGAFIECDEMKCTGCGICQMACSMKHFEVINKELSRIQIRKYLLPLPKAVQVTCVQCSDGERECEKSCPVLPPAIYFDKQTLHMVVDETRCIGCFQCLDACPAHAIRSYPKYSNKPFLCDLCDTRNDGNRRPECIDVCPSGALNFLEKVEFPSIYPANDIMRKKADEKAELIAKRLHPLDQKSTSTRRKES